MFGPCPLMTQDNKKHRGDNDLGKLSHNDSPGLATKVIAFIFVSEGRGKGMRFKNVRDHYLEP